MSIGHYPDASHIFRRPSDTHFVNEHRPPYGTVDSVANLNAPLKRLRAADTKLDPIVPTADLADAAPPAPTCV